MVSGAVARPSASSPAGSASRTTGGEPPAAGAASLPCAEPAKARAAASSPGAAEVLMRFLIPRPLIPPLVPSPLIPLHGVLRTIDLTHRLRGCHFRRTESARPGSAGDRRPALVAGGVQRGLRLGVDVVLLLNRHRPEARLIHAGRLERRRLGP